MLELNKVSKTFNPGTVNEKKALDGLSVTLAEGDFVTIVGSNGAGKSTFFNAVRGTSLWTRAPSAWTGRTSPICPPTAAAARSAVCSRTPCGARPHMTIEENLALAYLRTAKHQRAFFSRVSKADKAFFREQLARLDMGLEDRMRQPVGLLSGGQRQALTLLMATMVPPKLLLLDEHTAALDPATAEKVLRLTREIVRGSALPAS